MKKLHLFIVLFLVSALTFSQTSLETFLQSQPSVKSVEEINGNPFFTATYKIMVEQPVDHSNPQKGTFLQRVFVADKGIENPVLLITEGYGADYAGRSRYLNELSPMLNSNQICAEHRYFGESWPEPVDWQYLTAENAAADHNKITELFKDYYTGKWISTGISKGGQTAVYHRAFYPDDVDVTVAYVCPLNFGVEDGRHELFLKKVPGSKEQRQQILDFQINVLKNREVMIPKLKDYVDKKQFTFRIPLDEVLDYCVLEYPFALWQWARYIDEIPSADANTDVLFDHLMKVSGPSYFAIEDMENIKSFFVQAARELGYYGYDTKPLKKYLSIKNAKGYLNRIFLPESLTISYNKKTAREVKKFIKKTNSDILFIYGEYDPWSASGFKVPDKPNLLKVVKPEGSHSSRIKNLPPEEQKQVKEKMESWLGIPFLIE